MKTIRLILLSLSLLCFTQCDLELEPISQESSLTAYDSPSKMEAALVGAYDALGGGFAAGTESSSNEYYAWDYINFQDMRADNAYAGGDTPELFSVDLLQINPLNVRLEWHWRALYSAIAKANNVIEKAPLVQDKAYREGRMNQIIGEALFLRALHYYHLVTMWSGVPLVLTTAASAKPEDLAIARSTSEEVYAQILNDLDLAISYLPDTYADNVLTKIRATSGAANALAAKASLQKPTPDPAAALAYIENIENSTANYTLLDDYDHLFDGDHEYNSESIFEVPNVRGIESSLRGDIFLPFPLSAYSWRKFTTPSHDLVDAFQAEVDTKRLNSSMIFGSNTNWQDEYWGNAINSTIPFVYKWRSVGIGEFKSENNHMLIRYADIILLKAEALNRLSRLSEAAVEVNKIRNRVNLPNLTATDISSTENLKQAILLERRLELAFEGERWNDLARNGELISTMNNLREIDLRTGEFVNYNMTADKVIVPIPQTEMDLNRKLKQGLM
jgi:starch-binding outer membrane protein, SusD/RagB family